MGGLAFSWLRRLEALEEAVALDRALPVAFLLQLSGAPCRAASERGAEHRHMSQCFLVNAGPKGLPEAA